MAPAGTLFPRTIKLLTANLLASGLNRNYNTECKTEKRKINARDGGYASDSFLVSVFLLVSFRLLLCFSSWFVLSTFGMEAIFSKEGWEACHPTAINWRTIIRHASIMIFTMGFGSAFCSSLVSFLLFLLARRFYRLLSPSDVLCYSRFCSFVYFSLHMFFFSRLPLGIFG